MHESLLYCGIIRHYLFDVFQVQSYLRSQSRYLSYWISCRSCLWIVFARQSRLYATWDPVDLFHLFGVSCNLAPVVHGEQNWWSGDNYKSLFVCAGLLSCALPTELDLSLLCGRILRFNRHHCRSCSDSSLLWFFLFVHYQSVEGQAIITACINIVDGIRSEHEVYLAVVFGKEELFHLFLTLSEEKITLKYKDNDLVVKTKNGHVSIAMRWNIAFLVTFW